jgi:FtsP/CotA-like multicopper oxidase with cupredoxin domain
MKRRRFIQLAAGAAGASAVRTTAFASVHHEQEVFLTIRDRVLDPGETIQVEAGKRMRFHFVHAGASGDVHLHLPAHRFIVIALDGNPVPTPAAVDVLSLARGERIEAIAEMTNPGAWTLGSLNDAERAAGLGVRLAYANQNGPAHWQAPAAVDWSYVRFSAASRSVPPPDETMEMLLEKTPGSGDRVPHWIVDGQPQPDLDHLSFAPGRRYRLRMMNATDRAHPVHLPHHNLALTRVNQIPVSGIIKDTIRLERYNVIEADVVSCL